MSKSSSHCIIKLISTESNKANLQQTTQVNPYLLKASKLIFAALQDHLLRTISPVSAEDVMKKMKGKNPPNTHSILSASSA